MPTAEPIVAIELGTTKVAAMVGEFNDDGALVIAGVVQDRSGGVRKSEVVDLDAAAGAVKTVLKKLDKDSGTTVQAAYMSVSGGHIRSMDYTGKTAVADPEGLISEDDVESARELARTAPLPESRETMHTIYREFCIDGNYRVLHPVGMEGRSLSVDVLNVHGLKAQLRNCAHAVESVGVDVLGQHFGGLCSALPVLTAQQKKMGAVVIDLGGGTTDYLAYAGGVVAAAGSLGVGGDHVTNDISAAFSLPRVRAEAAKLRHAVAKRGAGGDEMVVLPADGGFNEVELHFSSLADVVYARVEEIFQLVRRRLEERQVLNRLGAGVVLTGGGSQLMGVVEVARSVFNVPCRLGSIELPAELEVEPHLLPGLSSCLGAILLGARSGAHATSGPASVIGALMNLLRVR